MMSTKHWAGSNLLWGCETASGSGHTAQIDGRMASSENQQSAVMHLIT